MFCRFCGSTLPDDSSFCNSCGRALTTPAVSVQTGGIAVKQRRYGALWFLLPLLALVIWWAWWAATRGPAAEQIRQTYSQRQAHTYVLGQTAFTLATAQYEYTKFTVPVGANEARVEGNFHAQGGGRDDVEVYILTEDAFVNWQTRHSVSALYNSGRVTQGTLNLTLSSGTYYLVFSNTFSPLSPKAIQANLRLQYSL